MICFKSALSYNLTPTNLEAGIFNNAGQYWPSYATAIAGEVPEARRPALLVNTVT